MALLLCSFCDSTLVNSSMNGARVLSCPGDDRDRYRMRFLIMSSYLDPKWTHGLVCNPCMREIVKVWSVWFQHPRLFDIPWHPGKSGT